MMQTSELLSHQKLSGVEQEIPKEKKKQQNNGTGAAFLETKGIAAVGLSLLLRCFCFQYRKVLFKQLLLSAEY